MERRRCRESRPRRAVQPAPHDRAADGEALRRPGPQGPRRRHACGSSVRSSQPPCELRAGRVDPLLRRNAPCWKNATHAAPSAPRTRSQTRARRASRARQISHTPRTSIGTLSSCPIVTPTDPVRTRKPSCTSGSRKNSTAIAEHAVQRDQPPEQLASRPRRELQREHDHDREQHGSLEERLVELGRVPRQTSCPGEHDPPRHCRRASPQLAVDEVAEPPEQEPDGRAHRAYVAQREVRHLEGTRGKPAGDQDAHEPAVERHPAVPDREDLRGARPVLSRAVHEHVAEPGPDDDADDRVEQIENDVVAGEPQPPAL